MTAVLAVEQRNLDQNITITHAIANDISQLSADSTVVGIKQGETYTLRDLLYGLLLKSGNDAAIAIAYGLAGNLPHFVAEMNQRAKQLGLYDTHYMNPHGLLATGHYSSAHDLAILGQYSMSIPIIHQISGIQTHIIPKGGSHPVIPLLNGNQFLFWYPGVDGGKPGFDGVANFVQVISSTRNHHHLIGVTMHTNNWWTDMRNLMNWGFDDFKWVSPHDLDTAQNPIPFDYLWNYFASDKKENTLRTADGGRYYIYTGYSISGPIMAYYDKGGGLQKYGYPISLPTVPSSAVTSQHFEKATIQCDLTTKQCSSQ
jgi:D-alanyl-D-alanine carboxypeptidase